MGRFLLARGAVDQKYWGVNKNSSGPFGSGLGRLRGVYGTLGGRRGILGSVLEASRSVLGPSWGHHGAVSGCLWAVLDGL